MKVLVVLRRVTPVSLAVWSHLEIGTIERLTEMIDLGNLNDWWIIDSAMVID